MKKNLKILFTYTIIFIFFSPPLTAQITLKSSFPYAFVRQQYFKNAGNKLIIDNSFINDSVTLYNLNGSLFKVLSIPPWTQADGYTIYFISEDLFDNDNSDFEYMQKGVFNNGSASVRIWDEAGNLLFERDSLVPSSFFGVDGLDLLIFATDSGTYMRLGTVGLSVPEKSEFYLLPGHLHCPPCEGGDGVFVGGNGPSNRSNNFDLQSFPNPTKASTKVYYDFPDGINSGQLIFYSQQGVEVRRLEVTDLFRYILVSTQDLPSGTYTYKIVTSKGISEGKQLVVVR